MTDAPCSWTVDPSVCDAAWAGYTQETKDWALAMASAVMWASTGRQFGLCDLTIRPCGRWDGNRWLAGWWWGYYGYGWAWDGWWLDGLFPYCGCSAGGFGQCGCEPSNQIWLPGPVASITSVTMNDTLVDPTTYRVDGQNFLVRVSPSESDILTWPNWQDMNVDSGANTLEVVYQRGTALPPAVANATALLASQYAKACANQPCMLPQRVVSIVRQNVSMHAVDTDTLLSKGLTGLAMVDQIIAAYNPYGLKARPRIMSPDMPEYIQTTWP